jgi:putative ABC transport system permease protein
MFMRVLGKSLARRKSRVALAVVAVIMGASVSSALLTTSFSMSEKLSAQFRTFGANIIVQPRSDTIEVGLPGISFGSVTEQRYINESELWKIKRIQNWSANVLGFAPFLYEVVNVEAGGQSRQVVLTGTYFEHLVPNITGKDGSAWSTGIRNIAAYWDVRGDWVANDSDDRGSMVGTTAAERLGLSPGMAYDVNYTDPFTLNVTRKALVVVGIVSTGGPEDSQIFVNLDVAQELSSRQGKVHVVQVSALCFNCPAEKIGKEIEYSIPSVQAKSVRQLVNAENDIMMRLESMMGLVTVVALGASTLGVMTTMTTTVVERRKEIGLMKAIGAPNRSIASLFLVEAAIIGLVGGLAGYLAGYVLAQYIGQSVFGSSVMLVPVVIPMTIGISLVVAVGASAVPIRRALGIEPAIVLRGD